jgi:radical SAM superfamily enzyme YgiQ (UPF0313 family)
MGRRLALLCYDPWKNEGSHDVRPFNYGVRRIQAAVLGHPELAATDLQVIESSTLEPDEMLGRIEAFNPDVIGVSAYVWSFPALLEVCRRAKRARPDRVVVFGGPSSRPEMCELPQHLDAREVIDALVVGDGEPCIQSIMLSPDLGKGALLRIPGLAVHTGDAWTLTGAVDLEEPDVFPSPYQMGLMPSGITCEIESFRGCPLSCSFCEWGDTGKTGRTFGFEYLVKELQALTKLNARGSWLVDAGLNLNSRAFRNLRQAEAEVGALKALGNFRCEIYPSHMTDEHLRFLQDTTAIYAGIGLQSFDAEVLKSVDRKFSEERFNQVVAEVGSIVPEATVEVMMGLPGDSPDNFKRAVEKVRKLPVNVRVFHVLVLPGALMKQAPRSFDLKYDPFTLEVISCRGWSRDDIEKTRRWLDDEVRDTTGEPPGTWRFFRHDRPRSPIAAGGPAEVRRTSSDEGCAPQLDARPDVARAMQDHIQRRAAEVARWNVAKVAAVRGDVRNGVVLTIEGSFGSFDLRVAPVQTGKKAFREVEGIAYSYERLSLDREQLRSLELLISRVQGVVRAIMLGVTSAEKEHPRALPVVGR